MSDELLSNSATWDVLSKTGQGYFDALVKHLTHILGVSVAFVVESMDAQGERVCPLASWGVENFREGRCYSARNTPCERLRRGASGIFADHLPQRFPKDAWLVNSGMQSYVGLSLTTADGEILGHIGALDEHRMEDPQRIASGIEVFVARSCEELLRARRDNSAHTLLERGAWLAYRASQENFTLDLNGRPPQGFLGFSREELSRIDNLREQQIHHDDRALLMREMARLTTQGGEYLIQYRLWNKDRSRFRRFQDHAHVKPQQHKGSHLIVGVLVDITAPRTDEATHGREDRKLLSRLGDLPGILFSSHCDEHWTQDHLSGACRQLTGYGYEQLAPHGAISLWNLVHPDDRVRLAAVRKQAADESTGYQVEYRFIDANGEQHHALETGQGHGKDPDNPRIDGFIVDRTLHMQALKAVEDSERRFRSISATAQDAILVIDARGDIVFWNLAASRIFGYSEAEALGRNAHRLLAPAYYRQQIDQGMRGFASNGEGSFLGKTSRFQALRKDGSEFPAELSISSLLIEESWHAVGIVRDVSQQEQTLKNLRESESRFRDLFEGAADGLLIADPLSTRFIASNRRMAQQLGYTQEELNRLSIRHIHPPQELSAITNEFRRLAEEGAGKSVDIPMLRKDGSIFYASINAFSIAIEGQHYLVGSFRDVTERRLAQQALEAERRKLHLYLEHAPVVAVVFSTTGAMRMINQRGCELLGLTNDQVLGKNWFSEFVPEEEREAVQRRFKQCFTQRACICDPLQIPIRTQRGERRLLAWRNAIIEDENTSDPAVLCMGEDITDRLRIEQDLQAIKQRLELVISTVPAVLYTCEPSDQLKVNFIGANLQAQFAIDPLKVLGHSGLWSDFAHPEDLGEVLNGLNTLRQTGSYSAEFRLCGAKRDPCWVQNELRLVRNDEGAPIEVVGYLLDITQRKQSEQALREREASLSHAQAIANLGSWENDLNTGEVFWSDEVFRILGYAPKAFAPSQERLLQRIHPQDLQRVQQRLQEAAASESGFDFEFRVRRHSGEERLVRARGEIVRDEQGKSARVVGTLLDYTQRRLAEVSLEKSRQALSDLAGHLQTVREEERAGIAREIHDEMGQALTAMKIDMVRLKPHLAKADEFSHLLLNSMLQGADDAIRAIQRVMAELRPSVLDELGLTAALEWQTEEFQERTGIPCQTHFPAARIDPPSEAGVALFRIFQEALTNVARHSQAGHVEVSLARNGGKLVLEVKDDGKGISDLDIENSRSFGLLGMRERAQVFGGKVDVCGARNQGTRVRVELPVIAHGARSR